MGALSLTKPREYSMCLVPTPETHGQRTINVVMLSTRLLQGVLDQSEAWLCEAYAGYEALKVSTSLMYPFYGSGCRSCVTELLARCRLMWM